VIQFYILEFSGSSRFCKFVLGKAGTFKICEAYQPSISFCEEYLNPPLDIAGNLGLGIFSAKNTILKSRSVTT
jgi:hypothetical protein